MKSLWQGTISFGLVNIPVGLYSAINKQLLGFDLLCATCKTPLHYERYCPHCNKEVAWEDTLKGLKTRKGYLIITNEKLKELKPEKTDTIAIDSFIEGDQLRVIYFDHHYYCAPLKKGEHAYSLFTKALAQSGKAAIGTFVMRDREHVCAITPYENGLVVTTLNYAYEIRPLNSIASLKELPKASSGELQLATQLIDQLTKKNFDLSQYKDTFVEKLAAALKKGTKLAPQKSAKSSKKEISLAKALEASLKK